LEAVCLRILSCEQVTNARALGSWLSCDDLIQLVTRAIDTPTTGFSVVYGVSDNDRCPVDNSGAHFLGYRPRATTHNRFGGGILGEGCAADARDAGPMWHGGPFAAVSLGNSGVSTMNIIDDTKKT